MRRTEIRQIVQEHGAEGYLKIQRDLLEGRKLPNGQTLKVAPEKFSLKALWEGLVGPVEETLSFAQKMAGFIVRPIALEEALAPARTFPGTMPSPTSCRGSQQKGITDVSTRRQAAGRIAGTEKAGP